MKEDSAIGDTHLGDTGLRTAEWSPVPRPGTRVLVTGACGGVGRALLDAFAELDCPTVGADIVGGSEDPGPAVCLLAADLADPEQASSAVAEAASALGGIDAVVGAAGIVDTIHRAATFPVEAFRRDIDANLIAQFYVAQAAYPFLRASAAGSIVLFSSVGGEDGIPGQVAYAAAKAGILGMTRSLAAEWNGDGIRVNAVVPGLVDTPKVVNMPDSARERLLRGVPMGRVATRAEVVGSVFYLLSPAAGYTTGQALRLDGGQQLNQHGLFR